MITCFDDAFVALIEIEKGYTNDPNDAGNWTGGKIGQGELKGTKYGMSAARYPGIDIKNVTLAQAKAQLKIDYWNIYQCDQFDPRIAYLVFDAAVNGGHPAQWLQQAAGVTADGRIGAQTIAAVRSIEPWRIMARFNALHLEYYASLRNVNFIFGWVNRMAFNLRLGAS